MSTLGPYGITSETAKNFYENFCSYEKIKCIDAVLVVVSEDFVSIEGFSHTTTNCRKVQVIQAS